MNPSPNRSSKSPKSTARKAQPSEPAVNLPAVTASVTEVPDESPPPVAPAVPADREQLPEATDAPASPEKLQRPRYSSVPKEQKMPKAPPKDAAALAEPAAPPAAVAVSEPAAATIAASENPLADTEPGAMRQHPIPPPSEPRQYRAVGLVRGRYTPSEEQFTRGMLCASDGTAIDAVLLGRVMSLVKNHLDLEQEHLWVVYPRTRQEDGNLHAQIMGVWEPETLKKSAEPSSEEEKPAVAESKAKEGDEVPPRPPSEPDVENGYFSIRGEVIYQSQEEEKYVIVKIKQAPRKDAEKIKFFKLKLTGDLATKAVGFFWDFHVKLQADSLTIQQANNIGALPIKKRKFGPGGKPGGFKGGKGKHPFTPRPSGDGSRPERPNLKPSAAAPPVRKEPVAKPIKKPKPVEE
ncbi:MAG: hypothetical protein MUE44_36240 [Oscillatoriaceae cyanobacterium Prado104]|nr:hypothetical protein [Oscillatoriaceae cyanobacterium Prado104]